MKRRRSGMCLTSLINRKIWDCPNWAPLACLEEIPIRVKNKEKKLFSRVE